MNTSTGDMPRQERREEMRICWVSLSLLGRLELRILLRSLWSEHSKIQSPVQVAAGAACAGTFGPLLYLYHGVLPYLYHGGPAGPYTPTREVASIARQLAGVGDVRENSVFLPLGGIMFLRVPSS